MVNSIPKAKPQKNATPNGAVIHKKSLQTRIAENWQYYILILPAIVYVAIWCYAPMYGLQIAFKDFKFALGINGSRWIGFRNFTDFFKGYYFKTLLENTFAISLYSLVVGFPVPIIVALILNELTPKFKKVVQTVLYAPHFISTVVLVGMMQLLFSPRTGIVNHFLEWIGGEDADPEQDILVLPGEQEEVPTRPYSDLREDMQAYNPNNLCRP